jgi:hypothetical protein
VDNTQIPVGVSIPLKDSLRGPHLTGPAGGVGGHDSLSVAPIDPLVSSAISHHKKSSTPANGELTGIELFPRAVRLLRKTTPDPSKVPPVRGQIDSFSDKSRARLRFVAGNVNPSTPIQSQFAMTYHKATPDGRTSKKHLNRLLNAIRREFGHVGYIWIMEFQGRGTVHYHLFLTLPHTTPGLHKFLADTWHRIAEPDSPEHLRFHQHRRNFIAWSMDRPGYLTKYLEKENQKNVPENFKNCGRFWGHSSGLVALPEKFTLDDLRQHDWFDESTGEVQEAEKFIVRTLARWHQKKLQKYGKKTWVNRTATNYMLQEGASVVRQCLAYLIDHAPLDYPF